MPVAAISAATTIGGDLLQGNAAANAGKAVQGAANNIVSNNNALLGTIGNDVNPTIGYGNAAGGELAGLLGTGGNPAASQAAFDTFRNSTNYNFLLDQGLKSQNYLNAPNLQSGASAKALNNYAQGMAGNALQGYEGLLQGEQGLGLQGSSIYANAGTNLAGVNANALLQGAGARGTAGLMQGAQGANALGSFGNLLGSSSFGNAFGGGGFNPGQIGGPGIDPSALQGITAPPITVG